MYFGDTAFRRVARALGGPGFRIWSRSASGEPILDRRAVPGRGGLGKRRVRSSHSDPFQALQRQALWQGRKCKKLHSHFLPILQPAEAQASFHGAGAVHPVQSHQDRAGGIRGLGKGDGMDPKYETAGRGSWGAQRRCAARSGLVRGFRGKVPAKPPKAAPGPKKRGSAEGQP